MKFLYGLLFIAIGVGSSMVADVFLKRSGFHNFKFLLLGFLFYGIAALPVALAFKYTQFGLVFIVWESLTVVCTLLIASLLFGESLNQYKILALLLAILALYLSSKA